jgi:hypothetical protein
LGAAIGLHPPRSHLLGPAPARPLAAGISWQTTPRAHSSSPSLTKRLCSQTGSCARHQFLAQPHPRKRPIPNRRLGPALSGTCAHGAGRQRLRHRQLHHVSSPVGWAIGPRRQRWPR